MVLYMDQIEYDELFRKNGVLYNEIWKVRF